MPGRLEPEEEEEGGADVLTRQTVLLATRAQRQGSTPTGISNNDQMMVWIAVYFVGPNSLGNNLNPAFV